MAYFKNFKKIAYSFGDERDPDLKVLTDITLNARILRQLLPNITLWEYYDLKENETPEVLAHRLYGNSEYHWVIMFVNERYDVYTDFPLSSVELEDYIQKQYPNPLAVKHYIDNEGYIVDSTVAGATPVSFRDYEMQVNDSKRRIKIVSPDIATKLYSEFKTLMGN